jgi:hypothetical protein
MSRNKNIDRLVTTLRRRRAVMSIFLNKRLNPKILSFATNSKNIELFCIQFLPFWGDVTISFLAFCLLKREKQKKTKKGTFIYCWLLWGYFMPLSIWQFFISFTYYIDYKHNLSMQLSTKKYFIACSNEILGWEGVGNRQLLWFFKA